MPGPDSQKVKEFKRSLANYRTLIDTDLLATPQQRAVIHRMVNAFEVCGERRELTPETLALIVEGARSRFAAIWGVGTELLQVLARRYVRARNAMRDIMRSPKWNERWQLIAGITGRAPRSVTVEVLRMGLADRSSRVRQFAIDRAESLRLKELVPDVEALARTETNANVKRALDFSLPLLRDGYRVEMWRDAPTAGTVWVRTQTGLIGPRVTAEDVADPQRLARIVRDICRAERRRARRSAH